jgi:hypothetical protein
MLVDPDGVGGKSELWQSTLLTIIHLQYVVL